MYSCAQGADHRGVGEAGVDGGEPDAVVDRLLAQGGRDPLEGGLGGRVGDLAGDARATRSSR